MAKKNVFAVFKSADFDGSICIVVINELSEMRTIKKSGALLEQGILCGRKLGFCLIFQHFRPSVICSVSSIAGMQID